MSEGANFRTILLIIVGVMLATTLFVFVLVFLARVFDWSMSFAERCSALFISCEHCGAQLSFEGKNCKSCGKPMSQAFLKKYGMRMFAVFSFELTSIFLVTRRVLFASIPFVLTLAFVIYERHYTRILKTSKGSKQNA